MKKFYSLLILVAFARITMAATDVTGHFHVDLSNRQIPVASIGQHFSDYVDLPDSCTFLLYRDTVDKAGYRHLSYHQYVRGTLVKDAGVLVHCLNGLVRTMNGEVRTRTQQEALDTVAPAISARQALRRVGRHDAPDSEAKTVWVKVMEGEKYVWHKAYEMRSADWTRLLYVDIYTGEVVTERSLAYHADVQGTAYTMYNGVRPFICHQAPDGLYYLADSAHNFITLDATNSTPIDYTGLRTNAQLDSAMAVYRSTCSPISNSDSIFDWTFHRYLKQVNIDSLPAWTPQPGRPLPNLYLKIYDSQDSLLYDGDYIAVESFPVMFTIPDGVETKDGHISVYLYDYNIEEEVGTRITAFDCNQALSLGKSPISVEGELKGWVKYEDMGLQPALDVHWGMQRTMDFYRDKLGRHGHDNHGGIVYQFYNCKKDTWLLSEMPLNAFAITYTEPNIMVYGSGALLTDYADVSMNPLVDIDVLAHEFTHLVTNKNGNGGLEYEYESGALNESFSDLMAMGAMLYVFDSCSWTVGSHLMVQVSNMRSMSDPHMTKDGLMPQPKYYQGQYWKTDKEDYGGVHTNSGVQNYWFYLLCEGGSGINEGGESFNISGIGIEKGVQIAYMNLLYYLTPNAIYADARWGSEQAAKELYGDNSVEYNAVAAAWDAVGVENLPEPEPTALESLHAAPEVHKVLRKGQVYILRDGVIYNMFGQEVR